MRIVSLVPSSTETLLALGADVVACTRFCEQPGIATIGGTKNPDVEAIVALGPDLVVMDREENRREDADAIAAAGLDLFVSDVCTVDDALDFVVDLAGVVGAPTERAGTPAATPIDHRTAFVPIWRRPWMSINAHTYGGSLLAHLGVALVTGELESSYPTVDLVDMSARRPELILVPSEPYVFDDRHIDELQSAFGPDVRVARVDGRDLFWWGTRTPAAMARLGDALRSGGPPPKG